MSGEKSLYEQKTGGKQMKSIKNLYKWCEEHITITIAILSFIIITLCSRNSFLYPVNFECDINVFQTIGRGMLNGLVPYKDLFDHKGPYVYLLFMLLELWEPLVYILEIIVCTISLYYAYKLIELYEKNGLQILIIFICLSFFNLSFHSAGTVEEFFFPMELYITYIGLRYVREENRIVPAQFFLIGIYAGLILWSKYTILGFFVGWCIVPFVLMIKQKEYKELAIGISLIILGVVVITIPAGIYLGINGAIPDFIQAYFFNNIIYANKDGIIVNIVSVIISFLLNRNMMPIVIMIAIGMVYIIKLNKIEKYYYLSTLLSMTLFTFAGGGFAYYSFPFNMFIIFALLLIMKKWKSSIIAIVITIFAIFHNQNFELMHVDVKDTPQYKFAEIINSVNEPTMLMYNSMDYGFYDISNVMPNCKYFFRCSIVGLAEEERENYLKNKVVDFYICIDEPVEFEGYELISEMNYGNKKKLNYYLYQLVKK